MCLCADAHCGTVELLVDVRERAIHHFASESERTEILSRQHASDGRLFKADAWTEDAQIGGDMLAAPADQMLRIEIQPIKLLVGAGLLDDEHGFARSEQRVELNNAELR